MCNIVYGVITKAIIIRIKISNKFLYKESIAYGWDVESFNPNPCSWGFCSRKIGYVYVRDSLIRWVTHEQEKGFCCLGNLGCLPGSPWQWVVLLKYAAWKRPCFLLAGFKHPGRRAHIKQHVCQSGDIQTSSKIRNKPVLPWHWYYGRMSLFLTRIYN